MPTYATEKDKTYSEENIRNLIGIAKSQPPDYIANHFPKYASRQTVTRFLARYELFKMVSDIQGCIVEGGVRDGFGLMSWAQCSAILEPVGGAFRHVYGFDTFEGFPSVHEKDLQNVMNVAWQKGDLKAESYEELLQTIRVFDSNRFLAQFPKVSLIRGDFLITADEFLQQNPHVLLSLLYLDFDLFEPTKKALDVFLPRMGKGSVIAFDEVNHPMWPGETLALLEGLDIRNVCIRKFPFEPNISYIVL